MDIVKMVDELLELEEKLDHFFLTSYERREFQKEVMDRILSADRKTESNSEIPNNSTISKMEQVEDETQTERSE